MNTQTSRTSAENKRRTVLKDNSWIRRNTEQEEAVDDDPNFGRVVLGQVKPAEVDSQSVEPDQTARNSGTSVSSLNKRFSGSQELLSKSGTNTSSTVSVKSAVTVPPSPTKPPVPAKKPALNISPNAQSSFTAKVFSANSSSKTLSPVKPSFGEKFPDVTAASQTTNGISSSSSSSSASSATSTVKSSAVTTPVNQTVNSQSRTSATNTKTSVLEDWTPAKPADKPTVTLKTSDVSYSPTRSSPSAVTVNTRYSYRSDSAPLDELSDSLLSGSLYSQPVRSQSESFSPRVSTSSSSSVQTSVTNTKTSVLEDWTPAKPADKPTVTLKTSDVSYSPTRSSPSAVTVNTRYSYRSDSAPLDELSDSLLSGSLYSQPVRSQTQTRSVYSEFPADSASLHSLESSRPMSSRDLCSVCGKAMAGGERMILEELKINSHTSCFRCAVCRCDLGSLEAGKSLWVYRERVNCSSCYSKVRGQWYI
ncbi:uncharacterized protein LOC130231223 isoform X2 [Danio aesculapii]|uniref:uncharacterized protein LOC130231223 isoform X2 n=1 Tax=Danio aesculapii TaxID=1142201 RepID=UPI0024C03596|nr:uncharacterized protein LOC130231223 isoform X2 [Danio aesculapii]